MSDRRQHPPAGDGDLADRQLEQQLRAWLDEEPDRPSDMLVTATIDRVRLSTQRPTWQARLLRRGPGTNGAAGARGRAVRLVAGSASLLAVVVVAAIVWQAALAPTNNGASTPPTTPATLAPSGAVATATGAPASPAASAPTPFDGRARTVRVLDHPATALGSGFGSLWLGDNAGRLLRIEPDDGTVIATIELGALACGPILVVSTSIWLTTCDGSTSADGVTVRVDPQTNTVADTYPAAGGDGIGISAMNGLVWFVSDVQAGTLTAVDALTGDHVRDLSIGAPIRHLAAGFGSLWVSEIGRAAVLRLDPLTGVEQAAIPLSGDAGFLATGVDAMWVAEPFQWLVGRIDPTVDRLAAEFGAPVGVADLIVADSGFVWALGDAAVLAIDPDASLAADQFPVPAHTAFDAVGTHVLALIGGSVSFADGFELLRIDPR